MSSIFFCWSAVNASFRARAASSHHRPGGPPNKPGIPGPGAPGQPGPAFTPTPGGGGPPNPRSGCCPKQIEPNAHNIPVSTTTGSKVFPPQYKARTGSLLMTHLTTIIFCLRNSRNLQRLHGSRNILGKLSIQVGKQFVIFLYFGLKCGGVS